MGEKTQELKLEEIRQLSYEQNIVSQGINFPNFPIICTRGKIITTTSAAQMGSFPISYASGLIGISELGPFIGKINIILWSIKDSIPEF